MITIEMSDEMVRGVRGATTVESNEVDHIRKRTAELLQALVEQNGIILDDIGAAIFSTTPDLTAAFPAQGARDVGWVDVPLFGTQEIEVSSGPAKCVRILLLWNTEKSQREIRHVYLYEATRLRPDLSPA